MRRVIGILGLILALAFAGVVLIIAHPAPLFAYSQSSGTLEIYSDRPIPRPAAERFLAGVSARLAASPLPLAARPYQIFVVNGAALRRVLWLATTSKAMGFTAYPLTPHHVFLSGAEFESGLLRAPSGQLVPPPRTLVYYASHELSHLATAQRLGAVRFLTMPDWIREGVPDMVAIASSVDFKTLWRQIGQRPDSAALWRDYGYYAKRRLLVEYFLDHKGWSLDRLLASNLDEAEAQEMMVAEMAGQD